MRVFFFVLSLLLAGPAVAQSNTNALGRVPLAWDPTTDSTVIGYNVYYGAASRTYTNVIAVGANTTVTVSNLVQGATYYFAATTYTLAGLESDYSAEVSVGIAKPAPPANFRIPKLLSVQTKTDVLGAQWADTAMGWPLDATNALAYFRLKLQ